MNRRPLLLFSAAVVAVMLVVSAVAWVQLPPGVQIPVHWGPDGQPDGYADKTVGLLLLPTITGLVAGLMAAIPSIEPRRANLERSWKPYVATWIGVILLMAGIHVLTVAVALGSTVDLTRLVFIGTGVLFLAIGNFLPKARQNFLMGVRTPWTLTSERSWTATHRLGGRLFVLLGLVMTALGILGVGGTALVATLLAGVIGLVAVLFGYSYVVWRSDPERRLDAMDRP